MDEEECPLLERLLPNNFYPGNVGYRWSSTQKLTVVNPPMTALPRIADLRVFSVLQPEPLVRKWLMRMVNDFARRTVAERPLQTLPPTM